MPRYRVFLTDLVTSSFVIDAETPEAAADEVAAGSTNEGNFVHAETNLIEVFGTDAQGCMVSEPVLYTRPGLAAAGGESDG